MTSDDSLSNADSVSNFESLDDRSQQDVDAPERIDLLWVIAQTLISAHNYSIVAVHGLAGKDFNTWNPKGRSSLSSLLKSKIDLVYPDIMHFQYEVRDCFVFTEEVSGIRKLAFELLEAIYNNRRQASFL